MNFVHGFVGVFNSAALGQLVAILALVLSPIALYFFVYWRLTVGQGKP